MQNIINQKCNNWAYERSQQKVTILESVLTEQNWLPTTRHEATYMGQTKWQTTGKQDGHQLQLNATQNNSTQVPPPDIAAHGLAQWAGSRI